MRIAIDAMGGDNAPEATVEGALSAAAEWKDTDITLVGDRERIEAVLNGRRCRRTSPFAMRPKR